MHLSDCLGGYSFYEENPPVSAEMLEQPRFVDRGQVTADTLANTQAKILEINSKTGLYPLYVVYSIFRARCDEYAENELTLEKQNELWAKTVQENIFVICKTRMAKFITKRTLVGYRKISINAHYFDDLINTMQNKQRQFVERVLKPSYWNRSGDRMKFNAVVGNPPYQIMDGGAQASAKPVYNYFVEQSEALNPDYVSMIMPARWYVGGKGLDSFRDKMINDKRFVVLHDFVNSNACFTNVDIKGGICYFLWDKHHEQKCCIHRHENEEIIVSSRYLVEEGENIHIRYFELISIKNKVFSIATQSFEEFVSSMKPYGLRGDVFKDTKKYGLPAFSKVPVENGYRIIGLNNLKREYRYIPATYPLPKTDMLLDYKVFITRNYGMGDFGDMPADPIVALPGDLCTETFVQIGAFDTKQEAENVIKYLKTRFFRAMVSLRKQDQGASKAVYHYVPMQDFTVNSDIDWNMSIDDIDDYLFKKYNLSVEEISFITSKVKKIG